MVAKKSRTSRLWGAPIIVRSNLHAVAVRGRLDEQRLRKAIDELQERFPRLRAKSHQNRITGVVYLLETKEKIPLYTSDGDYKTINLELENTLMQDWEKVDYSRGPFCWVRYVRHPSSPDHTGLLIFATTHGSCDGRSCEIVLSFLLKLYDGRGAEVPTSEICSSIMDIKQKSVERGPGRDLATAEKLKTWRAIEATIPEKPKGMVNQNFVDLTHPDFNPTFDGVCIEILRLSAAEVARVLQASRKAGTTLTGTLVAALKMAYVKELVWRGRSAEVLEFSMDIDNRRFLSSEYTQEVGNYVTAQLWRTETIVNFWTTARQLRRFWRRRSGKMWRWRA